MQPTMLSPTEIPITSKTVSQVTSELGRTEPQIDIRLAPGSGNRLVNAALHRLAAEVELATPADEHWIVQTENDCAAGRGRVFLEMMGTTAAEVERGMTLLRAVVG